MKPRQVREVKLFKTFKIIAYVAIQMNQDHLEHSLQQEEYFLWDA